MAHVQRFKAKKDFKLDCGHAVKAGETFAVTKTFTCEADAKRLSIFQNLSSTQPRVEQK